MKACPACGFAAPDGVLPTSAEYHRAHKAAHLARFPNVDFQTIANLEHLVVLAERGELREEAGWS